MNQLVVVVIGLLLFGYFNKKVLDKGEKLSEKHFIAKLPSYFFWLGAVALSMFTGIGYAGYVRGEFEVGLGIFFILFGLLTGGPLVIGPMKGLWEVEVKGDDVTVTKFFIFKKHFIFSEIEKTLQTNGGLKVYIKGRERMAFFMDKMWPGTSPFLKRIKKNNISITPTPHFQKIIEKHRKEDADNLLEAKLEKEQLRKIRAKRKKKEKEKLLKKKNKEKEKLQEKK